MISTILAGISVASKALDLISNNVANAKSYGFKTSAMNFQDVYSAGGQAGRKIGEGAQLARVNMRHERQGNLILTGNVLDIAIKGSGYFVLSDPDGVRIKFTRDGSFSLNENGFLVNQSGMFVRDTHGKSIQVPLNKQGSGLVELEINDQGQILATYNGQRAQMIANLGLANFENPGALTPEGGGDFSESFESGKAKINKAGTSGLGLVKSGALENSTTDIVKELVAMMTAQQTFSANAKMLQTHNDMTGRWLK